MYIKEKKYVKNNYGNKIILLMKLNEEKQDWDYLAAKKTICITKGNNFKTFYRLNCLHSFRREKKT